MPEMDFLRQLEIFAPAKHANKRVDIVGVGATGSYVAWLLAKIGMENLHIWDFDQFEDHNAPNQNILLEHIGDKKVDGVSKMLEAGCGIKPTTHFEKVTGDTELGEIVFLLTDTMESRKEIWEGAIKLQPRTSIMIETRMGADVGIVYSINPTKLPHIKSWEKTLYTDEEAEVSACGASISIAPTASLVASFAVWQMIKFLTGANVESELILSLNPFATIVRNFDS